jgi:hypothetical protein
MSSWIVEGWDSAMLQITGSTWGIPHSPGYPLYTILTNIFVRLAGLIPGLPETSIVWWVSFWSTVTSLLTLLFLYLIVRQLTRSRAIALLSSILLGGSFIFWRGAIMAEVYSFNTLIFVLTYWLALEWDSQRRDRWLIILGVVLGAGMAHHRTALILPPTIALWVAFRGGKKMGDTSENDKLDRWKAVFRCWVILGSCALLPLLSYLYLPWAAHYRVGQSWLYADTSDWNTFWFVVLTREWWGLVEIPSTLQAWGESLLTLFNQQASQITTPGVISGIGGLLLVRRYLYLFGPPLLALVFFGISYKVADLDSMLIPLTLTLTIGFGLFWCFIIRQLVSWFIKLMRGHDKRLHGEKWLCSVIQGILSTLVMGASYFVYFPVAQDNYAKVDLSEDWQAVDLVEEVAAIAEAGTPLTIIGQDNSVLPDFIYTQVVLGQPVEPLSATTLGRMPVEESLNFLRDRFEAGRRILVDIETIDLGFIPWLSKAVESKQIFLAPTGHPYLWELLPRPMPSSLPETEAWIETPPGQFLEEQISIIAFQQRLVHKRTGCFLRLTLFWRVEAPITEDYFIAVQPLGGEMVLDKNDHLALMRGFLPFSQVRPGEIVRDEVDMLVRQPAALPGISLVVNLYQVQGDQFPTFGQVTLPIVTEPGECKRE